MRMNFGLRPEDVEREVGALRALCMSLDHPNIVRVYDHGRFRTSAIYYIDMELCNINLHEYIHGNRPNHLAYDAHGNVPFIEKENGWSTLKLSNIWLIICQLANGLDFIHSKGYTHRDLKPRNGTSRSLLLLTTVLFRERDRKWIIADFAEATSNSAVVTISARGTFGGYHSPELVLNPATFSNKTDIWALGCIVFELLAARRAFESDFHTHQFSGTIDISMLGLPPRVRVHFNGCLGEMLTPDPRIRPSARFLRYLFQSYCMLPFPEWLLDYGSWKSMVERTKPESRGSVLRGLYEEYHAAAQVSNSKAWIQRRTIQCSATGRPCDGSQIVGVIIKGDNRRYILVFVPKSATVQELREHLHVREGCFQDAVILYKASRMREYRLMGDYAFDNVILDIVPPYWRDWQGHLARNDH
jgi:serine/threonine protein kinase